MHNDRTTLLERLLMEMFDTSGTHVDLSTPLTLSNQTNLCFTNVKCRLERVFGFANATIRFIKWRHLGIPHKLIFELKHH